MKQISSDLKPEQVNSSLIQPEIEIGQSGDISKKEADSDANRVMKKNDHNTVQMQPEEEEEEGIQMQAVEEEESIQMKPAKEEEELVQPQIQMQPIEEEEESLQMKSADGNQYASNDISQKLNSTKGSGEKLPNKVESEMGRKIGADFSATKIHTDSHAVQMNREIGAQAFTHGSDIYFNKGKYDPDSSKGKHLLAHELTHTLQQGKSIVKTKKYKLKQSSNDYIQRFPLNTTNINKLREHLSNDNETEAITLMGNLTVDEKDAVLNSREFKELAISSFGDDEMYRAMKALKHNLYKSLEWMFDEGTNWEAVANMIRLVPDKKDVVRTDNWMKKQFVNICDNETMAEAVDLLGGTLLEKLLWMHAEGSNWKLIKEKLTNPLHIKEKTTLYGSSEMLDFFVSNRNDKEMAEAVDILGGTLLQKLTWMKAEGSNWKLIKEKIAAPISATQKTDLYSKVNMREFFVSNCNDKEMAEAVDLLGGTLLQKLTWMKAEGSNWKLVKTKIIATTDLTQRIALYGSSDMKKFFVNVCNNKTIIEATRLLGGTWAQRTKWMIAEGVKAPVAQGMEDLVGEEASWRGYRTFPPTTFTAWANAPSETPRPPLEAATVINCWEMIIYAAHKVGVVDWKWIHDLYASPMSSWISKLAPSTTTFIPAVSKPKRGDLIFFNGLAHVTLATGDKDKIYSFWPPPNTPYDTSAPFWTTLDKVKLTTIKALKDYMITHLHIMPVTVTFGTPAW